MAIVDFWQERDRACVVVFTDEDRSVTLAEWWDEQVNEMIEAGMFKFNDASSVIEYCKTVGLIVRMNKCTFCGREANCDTRNVGGYSILKVCTNCEDEIQEDRHEVIGTIKIQISPEMRSYLTAVVEASKKDARRQRFGLQGFRAKLPPVPHYLIIDLDKLQWLKVSYDAVSQVQRYQYHNV